MAGATMNQRHVSDKWKKRGARPACTRGGLQLITGLTLLAWLIPQVGWAIEGIGPEEGVAVTQSKVQDSRSSAADLQAEKQPKTSKKKGRLRRIWSDTKYVFSSPLRMTEADLKPLSYFALTTGGLILLDETIKDLVYPEPKDGSRHEMKEFFFNFKILGDLTSLLPISGIAFAGGHFLKDTRLKETGFMMMESTLVSGLVTQVLKRSFGRRRPRYSDSAYDFNGPAYPIGENLNSFPSGHTTIAFAAASVVAEQYPSMPVKITAYGLAGLVGIQRMYEGAHWASDVFVGATIGTLVGKTIVKLNRARGTSGTFSSLQILPLLSPKNKSAGVLLGLRF